MPDQALAPIAITLPDGSVRRFETGVTGMTVAASIGAGLAKAALAVKVDGELRDLNREITGDARLEIVTGKSPEAADLMRHDFAHVMAEAVQDLYPGTQVTFGPATETGFYYDFHRADPFTPDDLVKIEARMREIIARNDAIIREDWDRAAAVKYFQDKGESFKAEWIETGLADAAITLYRQGDWRDLCMGPHLPSTGKLPQSFKLVSVSGAYWRGDAKNAQLQRIRGLAFPTQAELDAHLKLVEEAEKRDHRKIGREMGLFHQQDEAVGMVFWHPKGWTLYRIIENYMRRRLEANGYEEVRTPQLIDRTLWELSGHWDKYRQNMFIAHTEDERFLALKPMNCPGHVQIFRQGLKSYRDLPLRVAEFGSCHRYEPHGALHGIMRVRNFTQDDAHIFCTEDQITAEAVRFCDLLRAVYTDFGFTDIRVKFSDRPVERAGADAVWDRAEGALKEACVAADLPYELNPGEGAFYGPKLEFILRDAIGRDWQCGTLQVDLVLPDRLDAAYIGEDGQKHRPVMLHRAILGSLERFIGILIEEHAGKFPLWLAPTQAVICTVTQEADAYAAEVATALRAAGLRVELDLRNEKIGYKVREHSLAKTPVIFAVGKRDAENRAVVLRRLGSDKQETLALDAAVSTLAQEAAVPA